MNNCLSNYDLSGSFVAIAGNLVKPAFIGTTGYATAECSLPNQPDIEFKSKHNSHQLTTPDAVSAQRILAELLNNGAQYVALEASSHSLVQHVLRR